MLGITKTDGERKLKGMEVQEKWLIFQHISLNCSPSLTGFYEIKNVYILFIWKSDHR